MKVNTPIQVTATTLDKMYIGCLGIVLEDKPATNQSVVGFYYPAESGKNAFVKKVTLHDTDIKEIGKLAINPKP